MRFENTGQAGHYRIVAHEKEVGYVRPGMVGFEGFTTEADALAAANTASRALTERRKTAAGEWGVVIHGATQAGNGVPAAVVSHDPGTGLWGFEASLHRSEQADVFAMSRARTIWRALEESWRALA